MESEQKIRFSALFNKPPVRYQKTGIPEQNGSFHGATASFTDDSSLTLQKQQTNCHICNNAAGKGSFQIKCFLEMANEGMFGFL